MCRSPFSDRHAPASAFPIQFPASSVCRPCLFVLLLLPAALLAEWRASWVRQKLSAVINFVYLWTRACQRVCLSVCGWNVCGQVGLRPVVLHLTRRLKDLRAPLTKKKKKKWRTVSLKLVGLLWIPGPPTSCIRVRNWLKSARYSPVNGSLQANFVPDNQRHSILVNGRGDVAGQPADRTHYGLR